MTELKRAQLIKIVNGVVWGTIAVAVATPLFFSGKFYFPFIYPKSLVFELAAEVMVLVFFGLLLLDRQRHIRLNPAVVLYAAVIIVDRLAGIFGINFVRSFWSTFERAEGIFLHLHLLAFLFVITNFIRDRRAWLILFDISVLVSVLVSLVSLLQYFGLDWLKDVGDTRLAATVGNAAFFAGYLLFHIFIALFLYTQRREQGRRWAYATAVLLEVFILFQTGTRGAIIALVSGHVTPELAYWGRSGEFVFIAILVILQTFLIPALSPPAGLTGGIVTSPTAGLQEVYNSSFVNFIVVQGFFAGLVTGKMAEGSIVAGFKHSILLIVVGYTIFSVSSQFQFGLFSIGLT